MSSSLEYITVVCIIGILFVGILGILLTPTIDYSDIEATVKVQEVGTRYAFLWFGEQNYIRVQNVYSEDFASSSESWETCVAPEDVKFFQDVKNNKSMTNIRVKGNGISWIFRCMTGDQVISHN